MYSPFEGLHISDGLRPTRKFATAFLRPFACPRASSRLDRTVAAHFEGTTTAWMPTELVSSMGDRRGGGAVAVGQGVQPPPPNRLAPQRERFGSGGAGPRGGATAEQPALAGDRGPGGEAPGAERSAATSVGLALRASRTRRGRGRCVQHRGEAQDAGERSEPATQPPTEVAALCAAPPRARLRRALEAAGREDTSSRTGGASSPATPGGSALADVPQARPGGWPSWRASVHRAYIAPSLPS